jgi:hypothetical protein
VLVSVVLVVNPSLDRSTFIESIPHRAFGLPSSPLVPGISLHAQIDTPENRIGYLRFVR